MHGQDRSRRRLHATNARLDRVVAIGERIGHLDRDLYTEAVFMAARPDSHRDNYQVDYVHDSVADLISAKML